MVTFKVFRKTFFVKFLLSVSCFFYCNKRLGLHIYAVSLLGAARYDLRLSSSSIEGLLFGVCLSHWYERPCLALHLLKGDACPEFLELIFFVCWFLLITWIWPKEAAHVLLCSFYDSVLLQMWKLPQKFSGEKATELLKRAPYCFFIHDIHTDITTSGWFIRRIHLYAAFTILTRSRDCILRNGFIVVRSELCLVIISSWTTSTENTTCLILVADLPKSEIIRL